MTEPLRDLTVSHRSGKDISQAYRMEDVNKISERLGIPWEWLKDVPFDEQVMYSRLPHGLL